MEEYQEFLKRKLERATPSGFEKKKEEINPMLFDWQRDIDHWAMKRGRAALFEDCGMGKTPQQLEWAHSVSEYTGKPVLIVAPLAVADQTRREGEKFGYQVTVCRNQSHVQKGINICNYEMLDHFDASRFSGVVLDESSILKSYTGTTKRQIVKMFRDTPYKLSCTATPAPNDLMELLNQAEFLGIMKSNEALSCWFIADQRNSGHYRLKRHAERDFWQWVSSWAVCIEKPSDIGYSDEGYTLPSIEEKTILVARDVELSPMEALTEQLNMNATGFHQEKKKTIQNRVKVCRELVTQSDEQYLVWCYQNDEADLLRKCLPDSVEIRGSDKVEKKEQAAADFSSGKIRVLISKPSIFGYGLNFQNCHNMIFCGMDYSFESYYQAVRRVYRFGQKHPVSVWKVIGENEKVILDTVNRKEQIKTDMGRSMAAAMRDFQTGAIHGRAYKLDLERQTAEFPAWIKSEAV